MAHFIRKALAASVATGLLMGSTMVALAADLTPPSDVEGLEAFPEDGAVSLTWEAATDDIGVTGYFLYSGLSSVTSEGGDYTFGSTDVGDVLTYTMEGLTNGVTYYFAMTAYDAEGNESEFYSFEVEGTPEAAELGDFTEPTVSDAAAITKTLVEVEFSEDVVLPSDPTTAFSIEASDGSFLEVLDAYASEDDGSIVFVVTDEQTPGAEYILTASSLIEDVAANPVVSGTSDTAIFTGSSLDEPEEDTEEPADTGSDVDFELEDVDSIDLDTLELTFTAPVAVADPESFVISLADDEDEVLEVIIVEFDDDSSIIRLITEDMDAGEEYILTLDEGVLNEDGDAIVDVLDFEVTFFAKTLELGDLIAPEDVTNFLASIVNESTARLSWNASANTAGDLANYLIYKSTDGVSFGDALSVANDLTSHDYSGLTPGETYTFKVTAVDESGNESEGVMTTVTLPESGPGMIALGGLSLLGAGFARRKKKRQ